MQNFTEKKKSIPKVFLSTKQSQLNHPHISRLNSLTSIPPLPEQPLSYPLPGCVWWGGYRFTTFKRFLLSLSCAPNHFLLCILVLLDCLEGRDSSIPFMWTIATCSERV